MITIHRMEWDNFFSYGANNVINFSESPLTQIKGFNGSGKSSIPLILEELLYGKNSKGIKKADVYNRYLDNPVLSGRIDFDADGTRYSILYEKKKASAKIKLLRENEDISSHTATATLKELESIIGLDFKVFSQLVYQSSTVSLEFLKATDTNRKKFLVSLFDLSHYLELHDIFKSQHNTIKNEVAKLNGSISTITDLLNSTLESPSDLRELQSVPELNIEDDTDKLIDLQADLKSIDLKNKQIEANNAAKVKLAKIVIPEEVEFDKEKLDKAQTDKTIIKTKLDNHNTILNKISGIKGKCPTCYQILDEEVKEVMVFKTNQSISSLEKSMAELNVIIAEGIKNRKLNRDRQTALQARDAIKIDKSIPYTKVEYLSLANELKTLKAKINNARKLVENVKESNKKIEIHNASVSKRSALIASYTSKLNEDSAELDNLQGLLTSLDILKKSFGTSGLISFKLEYLVKDLENEINN